MFRKTAVAVAVLLWAWSGPLRREDVIVKSIDPDHPATTTQPDQAANTPGRPGTPNPGPGSGTSTVAVRPMQMIGGDWMIMSAFRQAKVTDQQQEKLKPVLDELSMEGKEESARRIEIWKKWQAAYRTARDNGVKDPGQQEDIKALMAEMKEQMEAQSQGILKRRERLLEALDGVLSADQVAAVKEQFERSSPDLATRNKPLARDWIRQVTPGVTLWEEQREQIVAKLGPIQEKYGELIAELQRQQSRQYLQYRKEDPKTSWNKVRAQFERKMEELRAGLAREMNQAVESLLTEDQKEQAAAGRDQTWRKSVKAWVDQTLRSFGPAKLTDEQTARAKELADSAAEAMLKTDLYDTAGRAALADQLREDIKQLLTDEQKANVR